MFRNACRHDAARPAARLALLAALLSTMVAVPALASAAPASAAGPSAIVDSGSDWSVSQVPGGYEVDVTLDSPLPTRDDIPILVADGTVLGPATESSDGLTLSLTTTDAAVAGAADVWAEWSSGDPISAAGSAATPLATPAMTPAVSNPIKATPSSPAAEPTTTPTGNPILSSDPTTPGGFSFRVADYNFGAQAQALSDIGGVRGEVQGRIYLPNGSQPHPLVIFMHGRHATCYNATTLQAANVWPCPAGDGEIDSYAGYDGAAEALASNGFEVVSIGANAINANDNQLSPDDGAAARGQEFLDTLTWLQKADWGQPVGFFDAQTRQTVTLDGALTAGQSAAAQTGGVKAASLIGTMDFNDIGIMGHSRGGEGAATATSLNAGLAHPWAIKSVFELAPIDFTRDTVPDIPEATLLPYCDGDVSDQQGEHFYADSKGAFDDNVLRSDIWVMGTDHDFYNEDWTPPTPGSSDDWTAGRQSVTDPVCGEQAVGTSRLTPADQYQVGAAYISGWFELTLGGQNQFLSMFDGTGAEPLSVTDFADNGPGSITIPSSPNPTTTAWVAGPSVADVRTVATEPASERDDIASFASASPLIGTSGSATAAICADRDGRTVPVPLPFCTTGVATSAQQPYWTPASFAPNVPLNQMTHLTWTVIPGTGGNPPATLGTLSVDLPSAKQDVAGYKELTVNMSPDESVGAGTDLTLAVSDGAGHTWRSLVSALNTWAVTRMPGSPSTDLGLNGKLVLQQVHVPTATLAASGLDLSHITNVSFTTVDPATSGGEYFQDLTFDKKALGTPGVQTRPTVNVASTNVSEGTGPGTDQVAVYLNKPSGTPITTYLSVIGSATGAVGLAMSPVTFQPGQTCQDVEIPVTGSPTPATTASTSFKFAVSDPSDAVLGPNDFGKVTVFDPNVAAGVTPAPPVGGQGDPCAEFQALSNPGTLTISPHGSVTGGDVMTLAGQGYRSSESVAFTLGGIPVGSAIANASGYVALAAEVPAGTPRGKDVFSGVGAGSGYTSTVTVNVRGGSGP
jgi:hypothetical protein